MAAVDCNGTPDCIVQNSTEPLRAESEAEEELDVGTRSNIKRGTFLVALVGVSAVAAATLRNATAAGQSASRWQARSLEIKEQLSSVHSVRTDILEERPDDAGRNCYGFRCTPYNEDIRANVSKPHRPFLKTRSWDIACPSGGCSLELCCDQSCRGFRCPPRKPFLNVKDYNINCRHLNKNGSCTPDMCCHDVPQTCWDHTCSKGYKPKPKRWTIDCFTCSDNVCCNPDHVVTPSWAVQGMKVIFEGNEGRIYSLAPPLIKWEDIDAINRVADWTGIIPKANWTERATSTLTSTQAPTSTSTSKQADAITSDDFEVVTSDVYTGNVKKPWSQANTTAPMTTATSTSTAIPLLWTNGSSMIQPMIVHNHEDETYLDEEEQIKEDGEQNSEDAEATDVQLACMLLGCVTFVMLLFSLVNYQDDDIRRYAWVCINGITSIFVAVLMFSSVNAWVLYYSQGLGMWMLCVVQCIHLFIWMCLIQFILACTSGVIFEVTHQNLMEEQWVRADYLRSDYGRPVQNVSAVRNRTGTKSVCFIRGLEVPVEKKRPHLEQRKTQMRCWGMLLAHMTGFAAINAGGTMQHLEVFTSSPLMALIPVLINQFFIMLWYNALGTLRHKVAEDAKKKDMHAQAEMFLEDVHECQNDISALAYSFLFVQVLRFKLVGMMPTMTGNTELPSMQIIGLLYLLGLVCFIISVLLIKITAALGGSLEDDDKCTGQILNTTISGLSMSFAWCFLFASRYLFESMEVFERLDCGIQTILGRIVLALLLSLFCLIVIFMLDSIDDFFKEGLKPGQINPGAEIVDQTVTAISILAGFSWEHAFDGGVEAIAQKTSNPLWTSTMLAGFVFIVVVGPWKKHILRKAMVLKAYKQAALDAEARTKSDLITTP